MVSKKNASRLARRVERIKSIEKGTLSSVVELGRELIAAEAECEHGEWASWLKTNFSWSVRTALRYRKVAEFCTACDDGAYGLGITLADMDISLNALYFVTSLDQSVATAIVLKAIDTRVTFKVAMEIAARDDHGKDDLGKDEQTSTPASEDDDSVPDSGTDGLPEADDILSSDTDGPHSVGLSLLADELDQNPDNLIAAARAFDPERLRRIVSQLDRVLKTITGNETIKQKADRAQARQS